MKYIKVTNNTNRIRPLRILNEEVNTKVLKPGHSAIGKYKESLKGYYRLLTKMGFTVNIMDDKKPNNNVESTRIVENKTTVVETTEEVVKEKESQIVDEPVNETTEEVVEETELMSVVEEATEKVDTPSSAPKKRRGKKSAESNKETGDING